MKDELNLIEHYILLLSDIYELDNKEKKIINEMLELISKLRRHYE